MLTVKHVENSGHESIIVAASVSFDPATGENNEHPRGLLTACGVIAAHGGSAIYDHGIVYVMNNAGSTVAVYNL